jgi:hypothetical protein
VPLACQVLTAAGASRSPAVRLKRGAAARVAGPVGGVVLLGTSGNVPFRLRVDGAKRKQAVKSVQFRLDGVLTAPAKPKQSKAVWHLAVPRAGLAAGEHTLSASVKVKGVRAAKAVALKFRVAACLSPRLKFSVVSSTRGRVVPAQMRWRVKTGGPVLKQATLVNSARATVRVRRKLVGKKLGTIRLTGTATQQHDLVVPTGPTPSKGADVLVLDRSGLKVLVGQGRGAAVTVTGLPAGTTGVDLRLLGKARKLVSLRKPCKVARGSSALVDSRGTKLTLKSATRKRC